MEHIFQNEFCIKCAAPTSEAQQPCVRYLVKVWRGEADTGTFHDWLNEVNPGWRYALVAVAPQGIGVLVATWERVLHRDGP